MVSISERKLNAAHRHSLNNRHLLASGGKCGCFHCLKMFDASDVTEWVHDDLTALCPRCGIDAVLSSKFDSIDPAFLHRMHDFWFEQTVRVDLSGDLATLRKPDAAE
jgi:NAD-dependent SIR2 family protein deacetylase